MPPLAATASADAPQEPPPPSHRRRFLYGLAGAALLGVGVATAFVALTQAGEARSRNERTAVVTLEALADLVGRLGGPAAAPAAPAPAAPDQAASATGMSIEQELARPRSRGRETCAGPWRVSPPTIRKWRRCG